MLLRVALPLKAAWRRALPLPVLWLLGCGWCGAGSDPNVEPSAGPEAPEEEVSAVNSQTPRGGAPTAGPGGPDEPAFDIRRVRIDPDTHLGEPRTCDVAFVGRVADVEGREAIRYEALEGEAVTRRAAVRCASPSGWGWTDLVFDGAHASEATTLRPGLRVRLRPVAAGGGFGDYPISRFEAIDGPAAEGALEPPPTTPPSPGFDFGRIGARPAVVGSERPCGVDFVNKIEAVTDRQRQRFAYPEKASHRMDVKCVHPGGDAWIDLVFTPDTAAEALTVREGRTISVTIVAAEGGFANRPVARWPKP